MEILKINKQKMGTLPKERSVAIINKKQLINSNDNVSSPVFEDGFYKIKTENININISFTGDIELTKALCNVVKNSN